VNSGKPKSHEGYGNPERSSAKRIRVTENVQRLEDENLTNKPQKRPTPFFKRGDEIVQSGVKASGKL
jgi:hypothetical protein